MPAHVDVNLAEDGVVDLELPQLASIRVVNEVESVAARGSEPPAQELITLSVLNGQMDVDLLPFTLRDILKQVLFRPN